MYKTKKLTYKKCRLEICSEILRSLLKITSYWVVKTGFIVLNTLIKLGLSLKMHKLNFELKIELKIINQLIAKSMQSLKKKTKDENQSIKKRDMSKSYAIFVIFEYLQSKTVLKFQILSKKFYNSLVSCTSTISKFTNYSSHRV